MNQNDAGLRERALALHDRAVVLDSHIDTTQVLGRRDLSVRNDSGHIDIPRLREGKVSAAVFAVFAAGPLPEGEGVAAARRQIDAIGQAIARYDDFVPAMTASDIRAAKRSGKIAVPFAIEGGYLIEDSLQILKEYSDAGAIYLTLTHGFHTTWADSAGIHEPLEPLHGGLTDFGREVVLEVNRLGMLVDISHVSDDTFWDVLEVSEKPVVATHSSCRAVTEHRRNMSDDMIRAVAERGGVVQINFAAGFLDTGFPAPTPEAMLRFKESDGAIPVTDYIVPLEILVDHTDHALKVAGAEHVGIGSDFDGVMALPEGMGDCSKLPDLTAALLGRGWSEDDLEKVLGANFLRVLSECGRP